MSEQRYAQGEFCWYELGTRDMQTALKFYTELMGWGILIHEMGEHGNYYIFLYNDQEVCAGYSMDCPQMEGIPPHWMPYVWVDDVDATAAKATELGGKVVAPPMDIPNNTGRMAVLQDPQGAHLSIYMGRENQGAVRLHGKPGSFTWTELMTRDTAAARDFYCRLFGWGYRESPMGPGSTYTVFMIGEKNAAGMMAMQGPQFENVPSHWGSYLSVADCDASLQKAIGLGATVLVPPKDVPNTGRFSVLQDPTGAVVSIIALIPMK